jgi:signal peptidase I
MIYLFFLLFFPLLVTLIVFPMVAKLYSKAGKSEADAKVPIKNIMVWLEIIQKPKWWLALFFVPVINYMNVYSMITDMLIDMGEKKTWNRVKAAVLPIPFLLSYANDDQWKFIGKGGVPAGKPIPKKSQSREWFDAILYAVIAATFIRMLLFEAYNIPTSSMEKTLRVGDFLFVSKFHYGPRVPNTPIAFPFAHHTMPVIGGKAYSDIIKLSYYRLPGFQSVKRNDMVVFNFPAGDTLTKEFDSARPYYDIERDSGYAYVNARYTILTRPVDKRENYIKRCVAIAGDTIQLKSDVLYVNGTKAWEAPTAQHSYLVETDGSIIPDDLNVEFDFYDNVQVVQIYYDSVFVPFSYHADELTGQTFNLYRVCCTKETMENIKTLPYVKSVKSFTEKGLQPSIAFFPNSDLINTWDVNNYGPLWIPKTGVTIALNPQNVARYRRCIINYEMNTLEEKAGKYFINGQAATTYTFKMDYYWMMGDNRNNSQDSRYWGFVPEDHVVGKAWVIWMSKDEHKGLPAGLRFNRIGTFVHSKFVPH